MATRRRKPKTKAAAEKKARAAKRALKQKAAAKRAPTKARAAKRPATTTKVAAKRPMTTKGRVTKRASAGRRVARTKAVGRDGVDGHPSFITLTSRLRPGSYAGGLVIITTPGALDAEMSEWLMGNVAGRRSIGRTAFGELLVFRDLRERARELGMGNPDNEADIALIDVHFKKMTVLGTSVESFLDGLDDPLFQNAFLRKELFDEVKHRLGPCRPNECYGFVPALALGGSEDAGSVQRVDWRVHQAILLQT